MQEISKQKLHHFLDTQLDSNEVFPYLLALEGWRAGLTLSYYSPEHYCLANEEGESWQVDMNQAIQIEITSDQFQPTGLLSDYQIQISELGATFEFACLVYNKEVMEMLKAETDSADQLDYQLYQGDNQLIEAIKEMITTFASNLKPDQPIELLFKVDRDQKQIFLDYNYSLNHFKYFYVNAEKGSRTLLLDQLKQHFSNFEPKESIAFFDYRRATSIFNNGYATEIRITPMKEEHDHHALFDIYGDVDLNQFKRWIQQRVLFYGLDGYLNYQTKYNAHLVVRGQKNNIYKLQKLVTKNCPIRSFNFMDNDIPIIKTGFEIKTQDRNEVKNEDR
ncbi:hypothetical protein [Gracilibacillus lacisalsi]|uniref:hypothetical protein n=1 Tax=Gracilibacillus lacisalsi TaxID=393087 RepID=UPI000371AAC6|nr:hypothetical protein [Gracilibacillus lacisalsi]